MIERHDEIVIYQSEDGLIKVDVLFENETVWLTQQQMAVLFGKATSTINEHIKNIYEEGELREEGTTHKFGISEFMRKAPIFYNLDVINIGERFEPIIGAQVNYEDKAAYNDESEIRLYSLLSCDIYLRELVKNCTNMVQKLRV